MQPRQLRSFNLALCAAGCLWIVAASSAASHSAQGIATRLNLPLAAGPLENAFFLFLLVCGFGVIRWMSTRTEAGLRSTNAMPSRPTAAREWLRGAALGWGMLLLAVIPMMIARVLYPQLDLAPSAWGQAVVSLLTLALYTLALEVAFRGFVFARLIAAIGPVAATGVLSFLYALASNNRPYSTPLSVAVAFLAGVLYSMAYLRTHALWLGWGMHFAWDASMAVLLGLPVAGYGTYSTVVQTATGGSDLLTGGPYGPEGALLTVLVLLGAMVVLHRISRDYAWNYTHPPIIAAGYAVVIAPPAAHTAMEAAPPTAALVQILSSTPTAPSTMPIIEDHLRAESNLPPSD